MSSITENGYHNYGYNFFVEKLNSLQKEYPGFKLVSKRNSTFCTILYYVLRIISFWQIDFYASDTVIYKTLYTGDGWNNRLGLTKFITLCHEEVHLQQIKKCFFGIFPIGYVIFTFLYLFFPLPVVFTARSLFEKSAYLVSLELNKKHGRNINLDFLKGHFTGPRYLWMCPFKKIVDKWFSKYED